jgi:site-specific recombinase XerD
MTTDQLSATELVQSYLEWLKTRKRLRPLTIASYHQTLSHYVSWLDTIPLGAVTAEMVEDFAARIRATGHPPAPNTSRREIVAVREFHHWASARHGVPSDAQNAIAPKVVDRVPKPIDDDVWVKLWSSPLWPQDRLWLGLGYWAGLRRFEIVTVPPTAVKKDGTMRDVERKGGSTQPIEYAEMARTVAEHIPWVCDGVEQWIDLVGETAEKRHNETFLWQDSRGHMLNDANRLNKRLATLLGQAGLPRSICTPHSLRHSAATNLHRSGVDIAVIAGLLSHSSTSTTMNYVQTSGQLARWRKQAQ